MKATTHRQYVPRILYLVLFLLIINTATGCGLIKGLLGKDPTPTPAVVQAPPTRTPRPTWTPFPTPTPEATPTDTPLPTPTPVLPTPTPASIPTPTPDGLISPLTGRPVADPALLQRRPLAVRIGNDPSIRPQEGLGFADVVYEEIMDGWTLTRFTAIYLDSSPSRVRPIRSARLSTLSIVPQYNAAAVHSGASDHIRYLISQAGFVDLDEYFNHEPYGILAGYDWRGRMYTSVEAIHTYLQKKGVDRVQPITGYAFDASPAQGTPALSIHIPYPKLCVVDWRYDAASGRYLRWTQGEPHLEGLTQEQIGAENVIVFYTEHKKTDIVEDSLGSTAIDIVMSGSGRAQIFRDGAMIEGTWRQPAPQALIQYYDANGQRIPLKPGHTWIQLVPTDYAIDIG